MDTLKDILVIIGVIVLILFIAFGISKCQQDSYEAYKHLQPIDEYTYLVYDPDTLVIYYQEKDGIGYNDLEKFVKQRERGNRHVFGPYFY